MEICMYNKYMYSNKKRESERIVVGGEQDKND